MPRAGLASNTIRSMGTRSGPHGRERPVVAVAQPHAQHPLAAGHRNAQAFPAAALVLQAVTLPAADLVPPLAGLPAASAPGGLDPHLAEEAPVRHVEIDRVERLVARAQLQHEPGLAGPARPRPSLQRGARTLLAQGRTPLHRHARADDRDPLALVRRRDGRVTRRKGKSFSGSSNDSYRAGSRPGTANTQASSTIVVQARLSSLPSTATRRRKFVAREPQTQSRRFGNGLRSRAPPTPSRPRASRGCERRGGPRRAGPPAVRGRSGTAPAAAPVHDAQVAEVGPRALVHARSRLAATRPAAPARSSARTSAGATARPAARPVRPPGSREHARQPGPQCAPRRRRAARGSAGSARRRPAAGRRARGRTASGRASAAWRGRRARPCPAVTANSA